MKAPEPDEIGKSILNDYWDHVREVIAEHARSATAAAAECPVTLFSDGETSRENLKTYCESITNQIDSANLIAFDALKTLGAGIQESALGTLATLAHVAIDNELAD